MCQFLGGTSCWRKLDDAAPDGYQLELLEDAGVVVSKPMEVLCVQHKQVQVGQGSCRARGCEGVVVDADVLWQALQILHITTVGVASQQISLVQLSLDPPTYMGCSPTKGSH